MKRVFIHLIIWVVLLALGFVGGQAFQRAAGYHYEVREQKEYASSMGPVHWSYVTETMGFPLMDPGTTVIKLGDRTLYKARRVFQESVPYAQNIKTSEKTITWDDGELQFHLTIEPIKKGEQDAGANGRGTGAPRP